MARLDLKAIRECNKARTFFRDNADDVEALSDAVERLDKALAKLLKDIAIIRFYLFNEMYLCQCCGGVGASPDDIRHTAVCAVGEARALRKELFAETIGTSEQVQRK